MQDQEQKKEIIRQIVQRYSGSVSGFEKLKKELWLSSFEQLQKILAAYRVDTSEAQQRIADIQADRQRMYQQQALSNIFRTPINGKVAIDNQASRSIIRSWLDETQGDTEISVQWFQKVLEETPSLAKSLTWQSADVLDPAKRRQAEAAQDTEERRVFHEFCRDNGFSEVEANFSLAKIVLGSFDQNTLAQAVQSGLQLAPASPEELEQFRQETIERHNLRLQSMDILSLRKLARENGARGIAAPPSDETQRIRQAERERNEGFKFPPLPDEIRDANGNEVVLNADYVRRCSKETMRILVKRYGFDQINDLLQNRVAGSIWEV